MDKKSLIWLGVLAVVLIGLVFLVEDSYDINSPGTSYNYTGVNGETYLFNVTQISENVRHVIDYPFNREGSGNNDIYVQEKAIIPFRYSPFELEEIPMDDVKDIILGSEVIYVTRDYALDEYTDQLDGIAMLTFVRVVDDVMDPDIYRIPTGMAITSVVEGVDSPVLDCGYANLEARVVELRLGSENRIYTEGYYCVIMEFVEPDDSIKVATKLTYHVLGLM